MLIEVGEKRFNTFREAQYHFLVEAKQQSIAQRLGHASKAIKKFLKPNKRAPDIYHKAILRIIEVFRFEFITMMQTLGVRLKKAKHAHEFRQLVIDARNEAKTLYDEMKKACFLLGRQRAIAELKKKGLIESSADDSSIDFERKKAVGPDGNEYEISVPVININLTPLDATDDTRINELSYSRSILDRRMNELEAKSRDWDELSDDEKDAHIDDWIDDFSPYGKGISNDFWITGEKAAHTEFGDWEALMQDWRNFETGESKIAYAWVGPEDDSSCDDCLEDMDNSPYDSIDECPTPGEDTICGPNCRHFVVLVNNEEGE